jgi:hypothetical protein
MKREQDTHCVVHYLQPHALCRPLSKECEDENLLVVEKSDDWH